MMLAWTFAARLIDEVARLVRAMEKHRYLVEVDHRIHWTVAAALSDLPMFEARTRAFEALAEGQDLHRGSRDPLLWSAATGEEVIAALTALWGPGDETQQRRARLVALFHQHDLPIVAHEPFESEPDAPPFPELVLLDWVFLPVDELDTERHAGVLAALEDAKEEVHASERVYVEGPCLSIVELCDGAPFGILSEDMLIWGDGPYAYLDYVFRGVSKQAKLEEPPVGPHEFDAEEDGP